MKKLIMLAVALVASSFPAIAETAALSDAEIIGVVQAMNQAEIDAGSLAQATTSNPDVKAFGQLLAMQHNEARVSFNSLAEKQGITPKSSSLSESVKADEEKHLEHLKRQRGILFDLDYASHEMEVHQKMLHIWDEKLIPQVQNEELKRLLTDIRASIADHLEDARKLKTSLGRKK